MMSPNSRKICREFRKTASSLFFLLLLQSCLHGAKKTEHSPSVYENPNAVLSLAAATNLRPALEEFRSDYQKLHPDCSIQVTYGSSGTLTQQILNGAPFDLFLSADTTFPEKISAANRAAEAPAVYCYGRVALWSTTLDVSQGMTSVLDPRVKKIAVANPELAPYGKSAVDALKKAGFYDIIASKIVWGENISQAAQFVSSGNAELGFVALSALSGTDGDTKGTRYLLNAEESEPIAQAGVVLKSGNTGLAGQFLDYLLSPEAKPTWAKFGYETAGKMPQPND